MAAAPGAGGRHLQDVHEVVAQGDAYDGVYGQQQHGVAAEEARDHRHRQALESEVVERGHPGAEGSQRGGAQDDVDDVGDAVGGGDDRRRLGLDLQGRQEARQGVVHHEGQHRVREEARQAVRVGHRHAPPDPAGAALVARRRGASGVEDLVACGCQHRDDHHNPHYHDARLQAAQLLHVCEAKREDDGPEAQHHGPVVALAPRQQGLHRGGHGHRVDAERAEGVEEEEGVEQAVEVPGEDPLAHLAQLDALADLEDLVGPLPPHLLAAGQLPLRGRLGLGIRLLLLFLAVLLVQQGPRDEVGLRRLEDRHVAQHQGLDDVRGGDVAEHGAERQEAGAEEQPRLGEGKGQRQRPRAQGHVQREDHGRADRVLGADARGDPALCQEGEPAGDEAGDLRQGLHALVAPAAGRRGAIHGCHREADGCHRGKRSPATPQNPRGGGPCWCCGAT
mmetsp:Transcript_60482/g.194748  ORF Transcript_60482/g.194748 Transcript_60482/m.194748 type:complete len:449 (-) Transcript_60482:2-1348(-)